MAKSLGTTPAGSLLEPCKPDTHLWVLDARKIVYDWKRKRPLRWMWLWLLVPFIGWLWLLFEAMDREYRVRRGFEERWYCQRCRAAETREVSE